MACNQDKKIFLKMVKHLFKKNQKIKEKIKENKKNNKSFIQVICRRCCFGGKCGGIHNRSLAKKARRAKKPTQRNSVAGQKDHFNYMARQEKNEDKIKNYKH